MNIEVSVVSAVASNDDPLYVNVLAVRDSIQAQQNTNFFSELELDRIQSSNQNIRWLVL